MVSVHFLWKILTYTWCYLPFYKHWSGWIIIFDHILLLSGHLLDFYLLQASKTHQQKVFSWLVTWPQQELTIRNIWLTIPILLIPSLKLTWHLKMDGWNTTCCFLLGPSLFSGAFAVCFIMGSPWFSTLESCNFTCFSIPCSSSCLLVLHGLKGGLFTYSPRVRNQSKEHAKLFQKKWDSGIFAESNNKYPNSKRPWSHFWTHYFLGLHLTRLEKNIRFWQMRRPTTWRFADFEVEMCLEMLPAVSVWAPWMTRADHPTVEMNPKRPYQSGSCWKNP